MLSYVWFWINNCPLDTTVKCHRSRHVALSCFSLLHRENTYALIALKSEADILHISQSQCPASLFLLKSCLLLIFYKCNIYILKVFTLYPSPNIVRVIKSRRMRWAGHVARMGEERRAYRFLVGKPEGKRPLGRPRRRWVDSIRNYLQEVGCGYTDRIGLAQDRDRWRTLVSAVMNIRVR